MQTPAQLANLEKGRFTSTRQPDPDKRPKTRPKYLTPLLKRFLNKEINYEDPETQAMIRGKVKDAIIWRLILNGTQGEISAIKEIFERLEGKMTPAEPEQEGVKGIQVIIIRETNGNQSTEGRLPGSISIQRS